ncbi:hypothetical protein GO755_11940 [Spirosoma sp. HMF4905]|uniref:Uncharacterized protein n=1 Tax=Spirosoma arboris TaxID=2682092 RepID=A0A7K1SAG8_9BACT|nr:hypothetical protein [Spirosoma arboris]MVM30745.1 hypothetical protein [Spirosoma arboris]
MKPLIVYCKVTFIILFQLRVLLLSKVVFAQEGNPPPCTEVQQVKIDTNKVKRKVLIDFIHHPVQSNGFNSIYDKGIVHLYEFHNSQGQLCWYLSGLIDDSYKDNPPNRFADVSGDIVLIYEADSTGRPLKTTGDKVAKNRCLEQIIGDRVFTRPTIRTRWTSDVLPHINRKRNEGNHRNITGNGGSILVIFNKDGTYKITYPA